MICFALQIFLIHWFADAFRDPACCQGWHCRHFFCEGQHGMPWRAAASHFSLPNSYCHQPCRDQTRCPVTYWGCSACVQGITISIAYPAGWNFACVMACVNPWLLSAQLNMMWVQRRRSSVCWCRPFLEWSAAACTKGTPAVNTLPVEKLPLAQPKHVLLSVIMACP